MKTALARARKATGGLLGGATDVAVAAALHAVHVDLPVEVDTAIATVLATLGTWLAPPNAAAPAPAPAIAAPVPPAAS
jgi:hypothetical protein